MVPQHILLVISQNLLILMTALNPDNYFIELADGSRTNGIASGRGNASVVLYDVKWNLT